MFLLWKKEKHVASANQNECIMVDQTSPYLAKYITESRAGRVQNRTKKIYEKLQMGTMLLQFRNFLIMATETASKKLKTAGPLIGTHKYVSPWLCP